MSPDDLWSRTKVTDAGCWEWQRSRLPSGYGRLGGSTGRRLAAQGLPTRAHRLAWALTKGPIPDGLCVCHRCDNRACIYPEHLFLGTVAENNHDMKAKGRARPGSGRPRRPDLKTEDVARLRGAGRKWHEVAVALGAPMSTCWKRLATG